MRKQALREGRRPQNAQRLRAAPGVLEAARPTRLRPALLRPRATHPQARLLRATRRRTTVGYTPLLRLRSLPPKGPCLPHGLPLSCGGLPLAHCPARSLAHAQPVRPACLSWSPLQQRPRRSQRSRFPTRHSRDARSARKRFKTFPTTSTEPPVSWMTRNSTMTR